ncbi:MAG: biopolymer transporter ExbD [Kiritimatiellae bacterium]|nr:biopolymer transporter ExbD [Kiritimatiellia bacterium]MDW8458782.1 biopolymer transporter ExbD [Verrucomicrobiota bacterium]
MARERKRDRSGESGELNMTAMIDVVFQLLIFFLVTQKPIDSLANLDVSRPAPEAKKEQMQTPPKMIRIHIYPDGFTINDRPVGLAELEGLLAKLASIDTKQTIMIMCAAMSRHEDLIRVLDLCAKTGLVNLSVISTN